MIYDTRALAAMRATVARSFTHTMKVLLPERATDRHGVITSTFPEPEDVASTPCRVAPNTRKVIKSETTNELIAPEYIIYAPHDLAITERCRIDNVQTDNGTFGPFIIRKISPRHQDALQIIIWADGME